MAHRLLLAIAAFFLCTSLSAEPLKEYLWKHRVIVSFSADKTAPERLLLIKQIAQFECEFNDRDLVHIDLIAGSDDFRVLSQRLSVSSHDFRLVLLGKDGEVKLRTSDPSLEAVMTLIDSMPMRQRERRHGNC